MKEREIDYLIDMLEAAKLIKIFSDGIEQDVFNQDLMRQSAVIRQLEIMGEAGNRISQETQVKLPQIPWRKIIGMRNHLIHEYDDIDLDIVWNTIENNLQNLMNEIEKIININN